VVSSIAQGMSKKVAELQAEIQPMDEAARELGQRNRELNAENASLRSRLEAHHAHSSGNVCLVCNAFLCRLDAFRG